jgi:hypothetical protein
MIWTMIMMVFLTPQNQEYNPEGDADGDGLQII